MATTGPSTPETPRRVAMNRSFTVPSKLATSSRNAPTAEVGATKDVETLYVHPNASIIKFSTPATSRPSSSSSPRSPPSPGNIAGALSWTSSTERTLAAGPLEIYRVPGSVSFLHSGSLLHAVLPRSQCWCVDGISKFALRVLSDTYYRIELPSASPEDLEKVEELKAVLAKVLFYERTACPFNRGFGDELPTTEELDGRKKTRRRSHGPAKRWTMDRAYSWKPEDGGQPPRRLSEESEGSGDATSSEGDVESETEKNTDRVVGKVNEETPVTTPSRPAGLEAMRSITAPPQLTVHSTPPSRIRTRFVANETQKLSEPVHTETPRLDPARLRTFQPIPTDMPPSPPDSSAGNELAEMPSRIESTVKREPEMNEETAEEHDQLAVEAESEPRVDSHEEVALDMDEEPANRSSHLAETPPKDAHAPTMQQQPTKRTVEEQPATLTRQRSPEDPFAAIQARILARRSIGGTTSFHPSRSSPPRSSSSSTSSTATLASQRSTTSLPRSREQQQTLASALVKKACAVFLGPPAHLVAIMLKIAARFANGAMGMGASFIIETPRGHKRVPGSFDLRSVDADDFDEDEDERGLEEWEEDDFGVPLRSPIRLAQRASEGAGDVRLRRGLGND